MLEFLVALLVVAIVGAIVGWTLLYCVGLLPDGPFTPPIKNLLRILVILILLLIGLAWLFGWVPGMPTFHTWRPGR